MDSERPTSSLRPSSKVEGFFLACKVGGNPINPVLDLDIDERLHLLDIGKAVLLGFQYSGSVPIAWIRSAYRPSYELSHLGVLFPILNVKQVFRLAEATRDIRLCLICMPTIDGGYCRAGANEQHCRRNANNRP